MNILEEIALKTKARVEDEKKINPLETVRREAEEIAEKEKVRDGKFIFPFQRALSQGDISFICEVKKASPSKGIIAKDFPYLKIAQEYEKAGAAAISCLTEPYWFLGRDSYLKEITANVTIPVLRKDFTVDEYMIYQAKTLGASAVLLIAAILDDEKLLKWRMLAEQLGMSALVEAHTEEEIKRAVNTGAKIIGVNNRNLKDFTVDVTQSRRLREMVPSDVIFVSESGIKTSDDICILRDNKVNAVLIGETLMRAENKKAMLEELRGI